MPLDTCVGSRFEQLTFLLKSLHPDNLLLSEIWSWLAQNTKPFSTCLLIPLFLLHYWLWVTISSSKCVTQLRVFLFTFKRKILFLKTLFPLHSLVDFCLSFIAQLIGIILFVSWINEIMIEYVIGVNYSNKPKCSIFYAQGTFSNLCLKHSSEGESCGWSVHTKASRRLPPCKNRLHFAQFTWERKQNPGWRSAYSFWLSAKA